MRQLDAGRNNSNRQKAEFKTDLIMFPPNDIEKYTLNADGYLAVFEAFIHPDSHVLTHLPGRTV